MAWLNAPLATDPQLIVIPDAAQRNPERSIFCFFSDEVAGLRLSPE